MPKIQSRSNSSNGLITLENIRIPSMLDPLNLALLTRFPLVALVAVERTTSTQSKPQNH